VDEYVTSFVCFHNGWLGLAEGVFQHSEHVRSKCVVFMDILCQPWVDHFNTPSTQCNTNMSMSL